MNVQEAIGSLTDIVESLQKDRSAQEERIRKLEKRVGIHDGIGLLIAIVVLMTAVFLS